MKKIILFLLFLLLTTPSWAVTRYVRTDGGTGSQCTGLVDNPYAGGANGTSCAVNHWNWVFPPRTQSTTRAAVAGDVVVVKSGSYRIGCQNPTTCADATVNLVRDGNCNEFQSYDCWPNQLPNNVTIVGCNWTGNIATSGCSSLSQRPEIWAAGHIFQAVLMTGSTGITMKDLIFTDHATCGYGHPTLSSQCSSGNLPNSLAGRFGIIMTGSSNFTGTNLTVRGFSADGIQGNCQNCVLDGASEISFNGIAGWDWDTCGNNTCGLTNGNTMRFGTTTNNSSPNTRTKVNWNGCVEDASNPGNPVALGCYNDASSGYGDGIGTNHTSGNWYCYNCEFSHNTSDGLDFLYVDEVGGTTTIDGGWFEGNAGNQLKVSGQSSVINTVVIGDCDYFVGKSFTYSSFTQCRSGGDAVASTFQSGTTQINYNNSILNVRGNGAFLIVARGNQANCTASNTLDIKNLLAYGNGKAAILGGGSNGFVNVDSTCTAAVVTQTNSNIYNFVNNPSGSGNVFTSPNLTGALNGSTIAVQLSATSPAIGIATNSVSATTGSLDWNDFTRSVPWDAGALEYQSSPPSAVCGNGIVESGEQCDDGNTTNGDGCSSTCQNETPLVLSPYKGTISGGKMTISGGLLKIQ